MIVEIHKRTILSLLILATVFGSTGTAGGQDFEQRITQLDFPISRPLTTSNGRGDHIRNLASATGVTGIFDISLEPSNRVIDEFFQDLRLLEAGRNKIVSEIKSSPKNTDLAAGFLNSVFQGGAFDEEMKEWKDGFDKSFVQQCAEKNDLNSITEWYLIRDLLMAGELPLLDGKSLATRNTRRPAGFDANYSTFAANAQSLIQPLSEFNAALPSNIRSLQEKRAQQFGSTFSGRFKQLPEPSQDELRTNYEALKSEELNQLAVRVFREPFSASQLHSTFAIGGRESEFATYPLRDPERLPVLPEIECRIVIVKLPSANPDPKTGAFESLEKDDFTDIVAFGNRMRDNAVLAIRQNGTPVLWEVNGNQTSPPDANAVFAFNTRFPAPFLWVEKSGQLRYESCKDDALAKELDALKEVVYIKMMTNTLFAITADGKRHLLGPTVSDDENVKLALANKNSIARAGFDVPWYFHTCLKDGTRITYNGGNIEKGSPGVVSEYFYRGMRRADGQIECFAGLHSFTPHINSIPGVRTFNSAGGNGDLQLATVYSAAAGWQFWRGEKGQWEQFEPYHSIVGRAVEAIVRNLNFLYLLFPSESVPRSGLWELEDLQREFKLNP